MRDWLGRVVEKTTVWSTRWVPSAFVIACLLTLVMFAMVVLVAGKSPVEALGYWMEGFWELLVLAMQFSLIMITGYMVAVSPPASKALKAVAGIPKTALGTVCLMGLVSMALSWTHWGLGLIGGPIFLRFLIRRHPDVDYRLLAAAGYVGPGCTWHAGLAGSAPLLVATPKHFMEGQIGIIPMSTTTFSAFNLWLTVVVVISVVSTLIALYPRTATANTEGLEHVLEGTDAIAKLESTSVRNSAGTVSPGADPAFSLARFLESSYLINLVVGLLGLAGFIMSVMRGNFQMSLNVFNSAFLFLALLLHPNPASFGRAAAQGTELLHGIIIQFPFYAGIYGLMQHSGLAVIIGNWFVSIASAQTFPLVVYWYSGILNYFMPSGGAKWAVEAPYIISAGNALGVPIQQVVLSYAWGDMATDLLQPFWAIPLLAVARLEFKDILGYLGILFVVYSFVVSIAFALMPFVW
ncbi:MAG: short-chain fatty acid transporter [Acidobacteria bacterium]|nr:short-chain fatty acid transporter [Acidobacteriota bacterium]